MRSRSYPAQGSVRNTGPGESGLATLDSRWRRAQTPSEMQTRVVSAVVLSTVAGAGVFYTAAASGREPVEPVPMASCPLSALRLSLQTQGTAAQSVTSLILGNPKRLTCSFSAHALFEVEQDGHRAPIVGNPLRARFHAILRRSSRRGQPNVWWGNWCRSRHGLLMIARLGGHTIKSRFSFLPDCIAAQHTSTLRSSGP
jgi:hypothetical protein